MTANIVELLPKLSGETQTYRMSFASKLTVGVTFSSATVTATVFAGTDASPSALISGTASVDGSDIVQSLTGGVAGVIYSLLWSATQSDGEVRYMTVLLPVLPATAL